MNINQDQSLRDQLARLADRSPESNLTPADVHARSAARRRHQRLMTATLAVALVVAGIAGIAANMPRPAADKTSAAVPQPTTSIEAADTTTTLDPDGPVAVTGVRIGESDPSNPPPPGYRPDGSVDLDKVPEWIAVGNPANPAGGCVGYVRKEDMWPKNATPETLTAPIVIYDENEQPIGQIANGETTIFDA